MKSETLHSSSFSTSSRLAAYFSIVRLPNCLLIGFAVIVGEIIGGGSAPNFIQAAFGFLTASSMMAGTMVMNDIYDADIDKVNSPHRPIPSGRVQRRIAFGLAILFSATSLAFAALLGPLPALTALLALGLMMYYNTRGKRTGLPGNLVVSFNVALPFFFGGLVVGSVRSLVFTFSTMAFLANTGREVAKGIPDVQGDSAKGIRSLAVALGPRQAASVSALLFLVAVSLSIVPPFTSGVSFLYFPGVILADAGFVYSAYRLVKNQTPESVRKIKNQVLVWMLLGLVGFLLGGFSF